VTYQTVDFENNPAPEIYEIKKLIAAKLGPLEKYSNFIKVEKQRT
jgi:hypothetical protein